MNETHTIVSEEIHGLDRGQGGPCQQGLTYTDKNGQTRRRRPLAKGGWAIYENGKVKILGVWCKNPGAYISWKSMINRCHYPKEPKYNRYGAAGIIVCDRWRDSFSKFYADMGDRPENTTIDRIDNSGNYTPGNCRWATQTQQNRNRKDTRFVEFNGVTKCITEWALSVGMHPQTLNRRLRNGMNISQAMSRVGLTSKDLRSPATKEAGRE